MKKIPVRYQLRPRGKRLSMHLASIPIFLCLVVLMVGTLVDCRSQSVEKQQHAIKDEIDWRFDQAYLLKTTDPDSALSLANQIIKISEASNYEKGYIDGLTLVAFHFFNINRLDTATVLLDKCLAYYDTHPNDQTTTRHGVVWLFKGYLSTREQNWNLARRYGHRALTIFRENQHSRYISSAFVLLGGIDSNLGRYADGLANYLSAYETQINAGESEEACVAEIASIALIYSRMGQSESAFQYGHKALRLATKNQDFRRQINILNSIGSFHSLKKNFDSAIFYYERVKSLALENSNKTMAYIAEQNIANAFYRNKDFDQSNLLARKLAIDPEASTTVRIHAHLLLGRNHLRLGQYDKCIQTLTSVWDQARRAGDPFVTIELSDVLYRAYEGKSRMDSALYFLTINFQQHDSIYNRTNQNKFNSLYAEMETMRKESRIADLKRLQELESVRNKSLKIQLLGGVLVAVLLIMVTILWRRHISNKQRLLEWRLRDELEEKMNNVNKQTLRIIYINNKLEEIKSRLKKLVADGDNEKIKAAQQALVDISDTGSLEKEWQYFDEYFMSVHSDFVVRMTSDFGEMSDAQRRLASLIKMNLTNSEIAALLNIEVTSVAMAKYRLKKKLQLQEHVDVQVFLQGLN